MNIDINQYDLSELFRFDILKNILDNLSNEQKKLREELDEIKKSNKNMNEKIKNIDSINISKSFDFKEELNKIDNLHNYINISDTSLKNDNDNEKEINDKSNQENNTNIENIQDNNKEEENKNINFNSDNQIENFKNSENINITSEKKKTDKSKKNPIIFSENKSNDTKDLYSLVRKVVYSLEEKINILENKLINQIKIRNRKSEENAKNDSNDLFEKLNNQINNLIKNNKEQDKKIEDCLLKCNSIDIYNLLKDNGDGTIDATKVMVNTLEDKVFKKFEFFEERLKKDIENIMKTTETKQNSDIKMEKIQKNLTDIKYNEISQLHNLIKKNSNDNDIKISDIIKTVNNKEMDLAQKISELESSILGILDKKEEIINTNNTNINLIKSNLDNIQNNIDSFIKRQNIINNELSTDVEKKINNFNSKINNNENNLKKIVDSLNINKIKDEIDSIKSVLEIKITKEHLKELYNFQNSNLEDINNINKTIKTFQDIIKKFESNFTLIIPKIDSLMNYFISKKNKKKNTKITELDLKKFIEKEKFDEEITNFSKKIEAIIMELESMNRNFDELKKEQNLFEKKETIMKIEDDIHVQIEDNKTKIIKNKNELNKQIKGLEMEIKSLSTEFKKRENAESWILAKHPMNCFNCATCDNTIKNDAKKEEYIPWNRIMPNKSYRIGKGFSHILERMSYELINNLEENIDGKEKVNSSFEKNTKNQSSINSSIQIEENKMNKIDKNINENVDNIAQLERSNSQPKIGIIKGRNPKSINTDRMRLPKVLYMAKKKAIFESFNKLSTFSEKGKNSLNDLTLRNPLNIDSPKILKIKKKEHAHNFSFVLSSSKNK